MNEDMTRAELLRRGAAGAAALSVPTAVMASPAMGAVTGALEARPRSGKGITLNAALHKND